ncbi:hypothetical protein T02_13295 [Trichinella nativa]|uniref:Uncharacterized protein n=1 Tax=Trichinella nativa TaxID=6335 RepID=A0A0V1KVQ1_9BILA|nr:hypothetical protein T02_13295 [Trichinella nativa]
MQLLLDNLRFLSLARLRSEYAIVGKDTCSFYESKLERYIWNKEKKLNYVHISQSIVVVVVQGVADLWSRCQVCDFALEICQQ